MAKPVRVRVDQATIKISAVDRDKLMLDRPNDGSWFGAMLGWLSSNWLVAAVRRFLATATRSGDDQR